MSFKVFEVKQFFNNLKYYIRPTKLCANGVWWSGVRLLLVDAHTLNDDLPGFQPSPIETASGRHQKHVPVLSIHCLLS